MKPPTPDELRAFRERHGLTQRDLARHLGREGPRAERTVSDWERGIHEPPAHLGLTLTALDAQLTEADHG